MAQKVKRPASAKVLTLTYQIQWLSEDEWYANRMPEDALGYTEREKALISLRADPTADEDALRATLLHELLHCCSQATRFERYLKEVEEPEEMFVAQVSPILHAVMCDNPGVVAYLLSVNATE